MDSLFDALERRPHLLPSLFCAILLFVGIGRWSTTYYTLVYWVTMIVPTGVAILALYYRQYLWVPGLLLLAIAFQPIHHFSFGATIWKILDAVGGAYMLVVSMALKNPTAKKESDSGLALAVILFILSLSFLVYALWKL